MAKSKRTTATRVPSCSAVYRHICENLDADLNSAACRAIKAHIADCPNCVAYLDSLKKTVSLYRLYPVPAAPARVRKRLMATIRLKK